MTRLKQVLETALPEVTNLGGGRNVDRDLLIELLRKFGADLSLAYWLRSTVSFVVLAILLVVIARYSSQPTVLATASTGMAITLVGALVALKQVIDEMARVNLILSVAPALSLQVLTEVVRRVVAAL